MYNINTVVNATILFVVLCLSSFTLHVSAVTGHHQVYFHIRSCHTARNLKTPAYCLYSRDTRFLWIVNLGLLIFGLLSNDFKLVCIVHTDC
jgi:hypothetical protein